MASRATMPGERTTGRAGVVPSGRRGQWPPPRCTRDDTPSARYIRYIGTDSTQWLRDLGRYVSEVVVDVAHLRLHPASRLNDEDRGGLPGLQHFRDSAEQGRDPGVIQQGALQLSGRWKSGRISPAGTH